MVSQENGLSTRNTPIVSNDKNPSQQDYPRFVGRVNDGGFSTGTVEEMHFGQRLREIHTARKLHRKLLGRFRSHQ